MNKIIPLFAVLMLCVGLAQAIHVDASKGYVQFYNVFNETNGTIRVIDVGKVPQGCVLWYNFSPNYIYYNSTDGYYYVKDLSGHGNDGKIVGLTGNVLKNATVVNGNGSVTVNFPYYNNVTKANLTVYWNSTLLTKPTLVTVYLNGNLLGSFVAPNGTTGYYTFTNVQSYIVVNSTNTVTYSSNNSILIEKTEFDYDHDLTLVHTSRGWALYFDGINDYIYVGDKPPIKITGPMTITCLFNIYGFVSERSLVRKWEPGQYSYMLTITPGKYIRIQVSPDNINYYYIYKLISSNKWYYVISSYTGSELLLTLEGVTKSLNYNLGIYDSTAPLVIGARSDGVTYFFYGAIGVVQIYNRSISQNEMKLSNDLVYSGYDKLTSFGDCTEIVIDSVNLNGSNYNLIINVSLPNDGCEHLIYIPSNATIIYPTTATLVATTTDTMGNTFNIWDVGSANHVLFNIQVQPNTILKFLKRLVFKYDDKIFVLTNGTANFTISADSVYGGSVSTETQAINGEYNVSVQVNNSTTLYQIGIKMNNGVAQITKYYPTNHTVIDSEIKAQGNVNIYNTNLVGCKIVGGTIILESGTLSNTTIISG